ncbi:MAG: ABC transporter permease [Pseudomonadota bacterium]
MLSFIGQRLLQSCIVLLACSVLVFSITEATPGSVARKLLGPFANGQQVAILTEALGLNRPAYVRYADWLGTILGLTHVSVDRSAMKNWSLPSLDTNTYFGNFGYSTLYKKPVNQVLWDRLKNSALLAGVALAFIIPISILVGVICGLCRYSLLDRALSIVCVVTTAIPEFVWGILLITVFVLKLGILPGTAPLQASGDWSIGQQLALPALVLILFDFGYIARIVRSSVIEVSNRPYVRTAVLKGLTRWEVVSRHILRNAMIAPLTVILLQINFLISGVVVTEVIFAYPGFGRMLLEAALFGDVSIIQGAAIVAVLLAILTQFLGDLGYRALNPRMRDA